MALVTDGAGADDSTRAKRETRCHNDLANGHKMLATKTNKPTNIDAHTQTNKQANKQANKQRSKQTKKQKHKQTKKQIKKHEKCNQGTHQWVSVCGDSLRLEAIPAEPFSKIAHTGLVNRLGVVTAARRVEHLAQQPGRDMDPWGKKSIQKGSQANPVL
jgi:hypothetical protein